MKPSIDQSESLMTPTWTYSWQFFPVSKQFNQLEARKRKTPEGGEKKRSSAELQKNRKYSQDECFVRGHRTKHNGDVRKHFAYLWGATWLSTRQTMSPLIYPTVTFGSIISLMSIEKKKAAPTANSNPRTRSKRARKVFEWKIHARLGFAELFILFLFIKVASMMLSWWFSSFVVFFYILAQKKTGHQDTREGDDRGGGRRWRRSTRVGCTQCHRFSSNA